MKRKLFENSDATSKRFDLIVAMHWRTVRHCEPPYNPNKLSKYRTFEFYQYKVE